MRYLKKLMAKIDAPDRIFNERLFILITIASIIAGAIALIGDIIIEENIIEIFVLAGTVIIVPLISCFSIYFHKLKIGARLIVIGLVFVILPCVFIFGGGIQGGCLPWIIFSYLYIGLILSGAWRIIMLVILTLLSFVAYITEYYHPELISQHSIRIHYIDSYISLIVVGIVIYVMVWFQGRLFKEENNKAREEAERADELNRSQNRFFSSMSHEIRTPIHTILGMNELILREEDVNDEIKKDAINIQGAGKMLLALINDILDFSKIEAGSMEIVPVDYRVGDLLSEVVDMIWQRAIEKGLDFDVNIDPNVPSVLFGDEVRIKQIIINILNNAVKYTNEGSVSLYVESEKTDDKHVNLLMSVSDTGIGIKQEAIPHLFDAFQRVDQEKNRHIEGSGLGLSIVHQLVELMGGDISVNSVYGQGSTFSVSIRQEISNSKELGNINIRNAEEKTKMNKYECMFTAPEAKVLIVDDNEINLIVEKKLLADTKVMTDTAKSGREALRKTLEEKYDVILMDHLMPEMDGIECLKNIRIQTGGMNTKVPVIVLTANAGGENRELYDASGFDGYLTKPITGRQIEDMLMKHIPMEKLIVNDSEHNKSPEMNTASGYSRKLPVLFASGSLSDIPDAILKRTGMEILPWTIQTEEGIFRDNVEISADEVVRYMEKGKYIKSAPPEQEDYLEFFGRLLKKAHHIIYIALTTSMSIDYNRAMEAARSFENVTVINSGCLSSTMGIMLLAGYKLAGQNMSVDRIAVELEDIAKRLHSGFMLSTTQYMEKNGLVSKRIHKIASSLELRPALRYKNDKYKVDGIWLGSRRRCYERYIKKTLRETSDPDTELLFITYTDISEEELIWIKEQVSKRIEFDNIIFQQASAATTSNCGPGTFGLLYMDKGSRSYNISSLLPEEKYGDNAYDKELSTGENGHTGTVGRDNNTASWYNRIEGIDGDAAIRNNGSEEAYLQVLELFYDTIYDKAAELDGLYEAGDWKNYIIKVHALKSNLRLIGAMQSGADAELLENAGKMSDTEYIREHHDIFINDYRKYTNRLKEVVNNYKASKGAKAPLGYKEADALLLDSVYEEIRMAADDMDCDRLQAVFLRMKDYTIPESDIKLWDSLSEAAGQYEYEKILELLGNVK